MSLHGTLVVARPVRCEVAGWVVLADHRALPLRDGSCAVIRCRDTLEYVRDDEAMAAELARVLRPGGRLELTVPHAGPLAGIDAYNLYRYLTEVSGRGVRPPETAEVGWRRHYRMADVKALLGNRFRVHAAATVGLALAEALNLAALIGFRWLISAEARYRRVARITRKIERLEDRISLGRWGAKLIVHAVRESDRG